jgi:phenylacetate-CoA ligase
MADFQPALVRGYPSSIYLLALHLLETGRSDIRPKAVCTSSEPLLDFHKAAIEQAFQCKSYSYYSNTEAVAHIYECSAGSRHVVTETSLVEVIKPDGTPAQAGEMGELICTGLADRAMPLLRYRIGDTGVVGQAPCACGRNPPILSSIIGRSMDFIITPAGEHVLTPDLAFKDTFSVKEAQIIQDDVHSIHVKIVARPDYDLLKDEKKIRKGLAEQIGPDIKIDFEYVECIPRTKNGKFKFVISKIPGQSLTTNHK